MQKSARWWLLATTLLLLPDPGSAAGGTVVGLKINGAIHPGTVSMIEAALSHAKELNAEALLIEMDTPGGLLGSTRDIVKIFLNSEIPVLVHVGPGGSRAGSAGTFITMAAHVAAMAPGTNIGAAHPVSIVGQDPEKDGGKHMAQKVENDTVAFIETIAKQRGRNAEWAKKSVLESASITEAEALKLKVIDFVARGPEDLFRQADGKTVGLPSGPRKLALAGAKIVAFQPGFELRVKNFLADPTVMFVLVGIAALGLYMEFSHPGLIFPAVAAGISIVLLLIATSVIPFSAVGVGLLVLGIGLLMVEIYVSAFGLLAAAGIVSFIIGATMLFDPSEVDLRVPTGLIAGMATALSAMALIIVFGIKRSFFLRQTAGQEGFAGTRGVVDETIVPGKGGRIFANGEYWNAVAGETLETGAPIEVVKLEGLLAHVKRVA